MSLNIKLIKNNLLKSAAYEADCKDSKFGYLNSEEFIDFKKQAIQLKKDNKINDDDFVQAMDLFESSETTTNTTDKKIKTYGPDTTNNTGSTVETNKNEVTTTNATTTNTITSNQDTKNLEKPSVTREIEVEKIFFGLSESKTTKYIFEYDGKTVNARIGRFCYAPKYENIFKMFLRYSTKDNPDLTPNETQAIKKLLYSTPADVTSEGCYDNFTPARNELLRQIEKFEDEKSDKGELISVKEQQSLLYRWSYLASYNVDVKEY